VFEKSDLSNFEKSLKIGVFVARALKSASYLNKNLHIAPRIWSLRLEVFFVPHRDRMQNLDSINVTEVLDRVLDHGIVMDPSTRLVLLGAELHKLKAHFVVESVQMYR
jgi:hypothetical protein